MRLLTPNESLHVVHGRSSHAVSPLHTCGSISQHWGRGEQGLGIHQYTPNFGEYTPFGTIPNVHGDTRMFNIHRVYTLPLE
jgi:hypothetical protein